MRYAMFLLLVVAGCGGSGAPGDGSGGGGASGGGNGSGGGGSSGGNVGLTVDSVDIPSAIDGTAPPSGRYFFTVGVTLTNLSARTPIPSVQTAFTLQTAAGLVLTSSPLSAGLAMPCAADVSLSTGSHVSCDVAFEVPSADAPHAIAYDDHAGDGASAAVTRPSSPTSAQCEEVKGWVIANHATCVSCVMNAEAVGGQCYAAYKNATNCAGPTGSQCLSSCSSADNMDAMKWCACQAACVPACASTLDGLEACVIGVCKSACP